MEQIRPHYVAQGETAVALHQGGDGGDQLRQRRTQRNKGQSDDGLRYAQSLGNDDAVVHQELGSQGDQRRAHRQQAQILREASLNGLPAASGGSGDALDLEDGDRHVNREARQQDDARQAAEIAGGIGNGGIKHRRRKEEEHRQAQGFRVQLPRAHGDGDGGNQSRVADDGADGVAVGDFPVPFQRGGGGNHNLR